MSAAKLAVISAVLNAYHKTRLSVTPVGEFIAANDNVQKAFAAYEASLAPSTTPSDLADMFYITHELIQEAKGAEGDQTYVISHLDEAENWLDKIEAAFPSPANEGEAVFTIRVGGDRTHLHTKAKSIAPARALTLAIEALQAERAALDACPYHNKETAK